MMTREEAIAAYEKLYKYMLGDEEFVGLSRGEFMELSRYIHAALRVPTREQVEKIWPGCYECSGCKLCIWNETKKCNDCKNRNSFRPLSDFCPRCGKPLTDEAVEIVMKRLEVLSE